MKAVLQVRGLNFSYPQRALFTDWHADVPPGVSFVRGGDGQGKSTLLRLLAGDLTAGQVVSAGRCTVNGIALHEQPQTYRQQVFWADPHAALFDPMTPAAVFAEMTLRYPTLDLHAIAPLMEGLSLTEHQHKALYMLSTGSRRKVLLAAAFASGVPLILLDNPFAALDKASIQFVKQCLGRVSASRHCACIVAGYEVPDDVKLSAVFDLGS